MRLCLDRLLYLLTSVPVLYSHVKAQSKVSNIIIWIYVLKSPKGLLTTNNAGGIQSKIKVNGQEFPRIFFTWNYKTFHGCKFVYIP